LWSWVYAMRLCLSWTLLSLSLNRWFDIVKTNHNQPEHLSPLIYIFCLETGVSESQIWGNVNTLLKFLMTELSLSRIFKLHCWSNSTTALQNNGLIY
jgi:hypothetical protein